LVDGIATPAVVADQRQRMNRRFCLVTSEQQISPVAERAAAYHDIFGDDPDSRDYILRGDLTSEWGTRAGETIVNRPDELPDAIVCANDLIAVSVLGVLCSHAISVPEQVRVVGFDDTTMAGSISPKTSDRAVQVMVNGQTLVYVVGRTRHAHRRAVMSTCPKGRPDFGEWRRRAHGSGPLGRSADLILGALSVTDLDV
jgi:hypothetical protein